MDKSQEAYESFKKAKALYPKARPLPKELKEDTELLLSTKKDITRFTFEDGKNLSECLYEEHKKFMEKEKFSKEELQISLSDFLLEKWREIEEQQKKSREENEKFFKEVEKDIRENC